MDLCSGGGRQTITSPLCSWEDGDDPDGGMGGRGRHLDRWDGAVPRDGALPALLEVRWFTEEAGTGRLQVFFD